MTDLPHGTMYILVENYTQRYGTQATPFTECDKEEGWTGINEWAQRTWLDCMWEKCQPIPVIDIE
jgi:hypothetical protein